MYVTVYKGKNGVDYVRISESYRDENGKLRHRSVKSLGRLDKQLEQNPNFLEELKAKYKDSRDARRHASQALHLQTAADLLATLGEDDGDKPFPLFRFGNLILHRLWKDVLGMDTHLAYLQKTRASIRYDVNRAASYLTFMKVLDPHAVLYSYNDRGDFLGAPARGISLDDCYDCYARLAEYKDDIIRHLNKKFDALYGENRATIVFCDVKNAYFEAPMTDKGKGLRSDEYIERLPEGGLQDIADETVATLHRQGPSRNSQPDCPLVSVALVIDQRGIPVDFEVYAGDASDFRTRSKAIEGIKGRYGIRDAIVLADRGGNAVDRLSLLLDNGLGFLAEQNVTHLDAATTQILLDLDGYQPISETRPELGCCRTIPDWKIPGKDGKDVACTLVLTWNEDRQKRDEALLKLAVETVKKKMAAGEKIGPCKTGWRLFAKTDEGRGQEILGVDEEAVAKRRKFCGFAAMVYRSSAEKDEAVTPPSGPEIAAAYYRLPRIEACFRAMTSNPGLWQMHVRQPDHIQGHIMACFLALVLVRFLQDRLDERGRHISLEGVCSSLNDALLLAWKAGREVVFVQAGLCGCDCVSGTGRESRGRQKKGIPTRPTDLSDILCACNLHPLPRMARMPDVARCLGTLWPKVEDAIPEERLAEL